MESRGVYFGDEIGEQYVSVALIKVSARSFPCELFITDAEFVYRDIIDTKTLPTDEGEPYFKYALEEGEYVGKSRGKRQFNRAALKH